MHGLGTPFVGILVDLFENDPQNAKANFEKFKAQYVKVSKLVPEWEKDYPMDPVEELGAALKTGDQGKVMAAYEKVGKVCLDCHIVNMLKVQQKYHWGDFNAIRVKDPLTNEEVNFARLMQYLDSNFVGIGVDLEEGQIENAQKQFQGFNARFQALKETCWNCHDTERKYYIDESIQALVDKLGQALSGSPIDPNVVKKLSMGIGMENCFKCHLVHSPAALTKLQWEKVKGK
jgi:cytochrome c556